MQLSKWLILLLIVVPGCGWYCKDKALTDSFHRLQVISSIPHEFNDSLAIMKFDEELYQLDLRKCSE